MIPLHKSDDTFLFDNYWPVSLLYVKVFERIMYNRLIDFLQTDLKILQSTINIELSNIEYIIMAQSEYIVIQR